MSFTTSDRHDDITDVPGIRVGNAHDEDSKTGVTVILPPSNGAPSGLHVGGSAPSTRQMDSLKPLHVVDRVHGICLCGGSAFGLDAAVGWLTSKKGVGFRSSGNHSYCSGCGNLRRNVGNGSIRPNAARDGWRENASRDL
jgi:L-aminopeptidase/D-esterase-like protein